MSQINLHPQLPQGKPCPYYRVATTVTRFKSNGKPLN